MTLRRRALLAVLIGFPVGWVFIDIAWRLIAAMLFALRGTDSARVGCGGSGLSYLVGIFNGCNSYQYRTGYAAVELVIGLALAGGIGYALARWVTQPLRQMTGTVAQLGPTNLGSRLRQQGPARDETRRLADTIDAMLDRLAEGYEAQRRFAANASHELRTPLATQRALIEISLTDDLSADQLDLLTRQLLATNERNERLIDGLLTLAETERGLMTQVLVPVERTVDEVVSTLRPLAEERGLTLRSQVTPLDVVGEQALLDRLLSNLVHNAVKYNVPGGRIDVVSGVDGPWGVLTVANTGPVVAATEVAGLFEPFRRLSGERLDHGGGVGLGLTIARSIVAAHHGTVTARPNPGGGLVVDVRLPRA